MPGRPRKKTPTGGPIRFTADYNHVEGLTTTAYKAGMVREVPGSHRKAAIEKGRAVPWKPDASADGE